MKKCIVAHFNRRDFLRQWVSVPVEGPWVPSVDTRKKRERGVCAMEDPSQCCNVKRYTRQRQEPALCCNSVREVGFAMRLYTVRSLHGNSMLVGKGGLGEGANSSIQFLSLPPNATVHLPSHLSPQHHFKFTLGLLTYIRRVKSMTDVFIQNFSFGRQTGEADESS